MNLINSGKRKAWVRASPHQVTTKVSLVCPLLCQLAPYLSVTYQLGAGGFCSTFRPDTCPQSPCKEGDRKGLAGSRRDKGTGEKERQRG